MDQETQLLITESVNLYEPIVAGESGRIKNGCQLWRQFQNAIEACEQGTTGAERQLQEKINELATAKFLSEDPNLPGGATYEPDFLPSGKKIDFVAEREADNLYVEVKTVKPEAADSDDTWGKYQELRQFHPQNVNFIVREDWMGGMIYANTFASRSKFLLYSLAFEERLEEAQSIREGPGILVFCGTGFQWNVTDLEDFADYYRFGTHRADDPFALMEQHEVENNNIKLRRNISDFSFAQRRSRSAKVQKMHFPVRGPQIGR
ncbi:hypothetical protein ACFMBG_15115 [Leisingera sp. D0M16]|uniref:hypothetical protein n=1 Tax=Leisingera coralii TaxID=3351347 RepID=UPI003B7E99E8